MSRTSSHRFDRPLRVELRASRLLLSSGLMLYALTALSCAWLPVHGAWRAGLCVLLCLHFVRVYRLHISASTPQAIAALHWDARRGWRARDARGDWQSVALCTPVFVSYRLVVARFRGASPRARSVMVVPDRTGVEDFRRLRVRLIQSAHGDRNRTEIPGQG